MAGGEEVKADYDQLEQVAQGFSNQAQNTEDLIQKLQSSLDPLQDGGWIGRGSDAFFDEMGGEVMPAVQRLREALEEASAVTKQIAQLMQQAEEEASSIFKNWRA